MRTIKESILSKKSGIYDIDGLLPFHKEDIQLDLLADRLDKFGLHEVPHSTNLVYYTKKNHVGCFSTSKFIADKRILVSICPNDSGKIFMMMLLPDVGKSAKIERLLINDYGTRTHIENPPYNEFRDELTCELDKTA